jgi:hypothetical protein
MQRLSYANYLLVSTDRHSVLRATDDETTRYRAQCKLTTGSDIMPAVITKGRLIPRGQLGFRFFDAFNA